MKKIVTIVGARPQFVKAAVVSRALEHEGINEVIVHTGQHFDKNMSDIFFEEMQIPKPSYKLEISNLTHGAMTGRMLENIEKVLIEEHPDLVLVYGDTNSTLAGALAASKLQIPIAHVEAGLRSFNMSMPEEINRIITDRLSTLLFCPTLAAIDNLNREGFEHFQSKILLSGDVMQDAALYYAELAESRSHIIDTLFPTPTPFVLATIHRQENTNDPENLKQLVNALNHINQIMRVIVPIHPRTRKIMESSGLHFNFTTIEPVGYFDMLQLIKNCQLVLTDSGGLQKEAFFFGRHCITLREETEWIELVDYGFNVLAGCNSSKIQKAFDQLKEKHSDFSVNLYGNGTASATIAKYLANL